MAAERLAGWLPCRSTGPVVVVAGPVEADATVVVDARLLVGARVVVGPVEGGMLVVVDTMLVVVTIVVVGAAVVAVAAVVVGLAVVGGAVAESWVVVAPEDERAVPVVAPTLAGAGAVAGRAVVAGPLMAPCSGPGVVDGEVVWSVPGRRWRWWSRRQLVLARVARWAARPRVRGVAVGVGAAGWPRPPGRPGSRW